MSKGKWEDFCHRAQEWSREVDAEFAKGWEGAEGKREWEAGWRGALMAMAKAPQLEVYRCACACVCVGVGVGAGAWGMCLCAPVQPRSLLSVRACADWRSGLWGATCAP